MSDISLAINIAVESGEVVPREESNFSLSVPMGTAPQRATNVRVNSRNKMIAIRSNTSYGEEYFTIIGDQAFQGEPSRLAPFGTFVWKNSQVESSTDPLNQSSMEDQRRRAVLSQRLRAQIAAAVQENDPNDPAFDVEVAAFIEAMLWRYGADSVEVVRDFISDPKVSSELRHVILLALARADHEESKDARRNLFALFLDSTDASARYSAVVALGAMKGERSLALLSKRQKNERNRSVANLIKAHLR